MVWLKEKCPEVYHKTRWILGSKDWIRYCLTGNAHADRSDAPAPVEESTGEYQKDSMVRAGIPECADKLPPLKYASEICGRVTRRAAKETGLLEGTYVVAGAHDMIACSIGCGGRRQGHLTIIMGTMGINIAVLDKNTGLNKYRSGECFEFGGVSEGLKMVTTSIGSRLPLHRFSHLWPSRVRVLPALQFRHPLRARSRPVPYQTEWKHASGPACRLRCVL